MFLLPHALLLFLPLYSTIQIMLSYQCTSDATLFFEERISS